MVPVHSLAQLKNPQKLDVPYEPTPQEVVLLMLQLAKVQKGDIVYDLGCGDGRIIVTAARLFGATGVGIEIDPMRLAESRENAKRAGVENRVNFLKEDLFQADIREASVVTLFLSREVNLRLLPRLLRELRPGTRVVSFYWDMDEWKPEKRVEYDGEPIYLWIIPANSGPAKVLIDKTD
jgi:precorrin-6B methylase 2